ncbi:kelch domain-containing protein 10-like, partial [Saccoglossus kowalevskii]|uniref:Kelch domain-containing protein 10-like n=1 Tax=Saccoglossus kowalevskii TaxID=10224 RepID=A0ABM0MR94_SACKO
EISPYPRSGHCCAADDSNLYIYGGYNPVYEVRNVKPVYNKLFRELWSYNFSTCTWTLENDTNGEIPEETASMSMAISGNCLLLFGGTSFPWGEKSNKDVYVYLIKQKKWDKLQCIGDSPPAKYGQ